MSVIGGGKCKNCGHDITKLAKAWAHGKDSEMQQGSKLYHSKDGMTSNCCTVDGCKCCNPEPKEEKKKGE